MLGLNRSNGDTGPAALLMPRRYNAAQDFIGGRLAAGRGGEVAYGDGRGRCTYGELAGRVNRFANALGGLGVRRQERILLCLLEGIDFPTVLLGAIQAGVVPVASNALPTPADCRHLLADSQACLLVVSRALWPHFETLADVVPTLRQVVLSGGEARGRLELTDLLIRAGNDFPAAETRSDDPCLWLYSRDSAGQPERTVYSQGSLANIGDLQALPVTPLRQGGAAFDPMAGHTAPRKWLRRRAPAMAGE